jgi:indolepyruvate ferredoxin oxidoreductase
MFGPLRLLAALRFLRGTVLDPFRFSPDRQAERADIARHEKLAEEIVSELTPANLETAIELVSLPLDIRGYGPVRARYAAKARQRETELKRSFLAASESREQQWSGHLA